MKILFFTRVFALIVLASCIAVGIQHGPWAALFTAAAMGSAAAHLSRPAQVLGANDLQGINIAQIAQENLTLLTPRMVALSNITADFSTDVSDIGESVTTRIATDEDADDFSGGITASDARSQKFTILLDQELGKAKAFTQAELSKGGMDLLRRTFMPAAVTAVAKGVFKKVVGLVTAANFANAVTITAANFDADAIADRNTELTNRFVPDYYRFGILNPNYYGNVTKDNSVQSYLNSGSTDPLYRRRLTKLGGFDYIDETAAFPTAGTTVTENLQGFFGSKESLLMAARLPATPPEGSTDVQFENVIEPVTKFPMQYQFFYMPKERKWYIAVVTLFGVLAGPGASLTRVKNV